MKPKRLLTHSYISVKKCKHGTFAFNNNDAFIGRSLNLYGEWAEEELEVMGQLIKPEDIVLDIGAFIGTHTIFFAKQVGPKGFVHAFEPQRIPYYNLCANITLNAFINVNAINVAVSNQPGKTHIPTFDPTKKSNFGAVDITKFETGEPIQVITIDQLNLPRCNLIKIDVERHEPQVLEGATKTINQHRPFLFVENNTPQASSRILTTIKNLNYNSWWLISGYYNPKNFFKNKNNVFKGFVPEANLLCVPKEKSSLINGLEPVKGINDNWEKALKRTAKKLTHAKPPKTKK